MQIIRLRAWSFVKLFLAHLKASKLRLLLLLTYVCPLFSFIKFAQRQLRSDAICSVLQAPVGCHHAPLPSSSLHRDPPNFDAVRRHLSRRVMLSLVLPGMVWVCSDLANILELCWVLQSFSELHWTHLFSIALYQAPLSSINFHWVSTRFTNFHQDPKNFFR